MKVQKHDLKMMQFSLKVFSTATLFFVLFFLKASAQVYVAPVALYLSDGDRTGRINILNRTGRPVELDIDLVYGYPASDEQGNIFMQYSDTPHKEKNSASGWIRVYPRHLVLPHGEQQTVRFAARPPAGLPNGEYWVRPAVKFRSAIQHNVDNAVDAQNLNVELDVIKRTILSLNFRHGDVSTGIDIQDISTSLENKNLQVLVDLKREGNAAYLGYLTLKLFDRQGQQLKKAKYEIAVYKELTRKIELDVSHLPTGSYTAEIELNTNRRGNKPGDILQAEPVKKMIKVVLP